MLKQVQHDKILGDLMKVTLSRFAGFCDGVKRAYEIVSSFRVSKNNQPVFILDSLVHNQDVVSKISKKGIKTINFQEFLGSKKGKIKTLIISAHGAGPEVYEIARRRKIKIIDATCLKVIKVQRLAQFFAKKSYQVVLVGDKNHKEIRGIYEWGDKKAVIVSSEKDFKKINFDAGAKVAVLSQTTQNLDFFKKVCRYVNGRCSEVNITNTICLATENRQEEVKKMAQSSEAMVIIGSPTSANSRRLFEISKALNSRSFFIENKNDLRESWFKGVGKVGVTAGASTPEWVIEEVVEYLKVD